MLMGHIQNRKHPICFGRKDEMTMETTVKLELLKRHNKKNVGDTIEVRPGDARVLKAVGIAKDYAEPASVGRAVPRTATRVMQPGTIAAEVSNLGSVSNEVEPAEFGRQPYSRRDMKPEE